MPFIWSYVVSVSVVQLSIVDNAPLNLLLYLELDYRKQYNMIVALITLMWWNDHVTDGSKK